MTIVEQVEIYFRNNKNCWVTTTASPASNPVDCSVASERELLTKYNSRELLDS